MIAGLVALGVVRYLVSNQEKIARNVERFNPAEVEKNILGAISRLGKGEVPLDPEQKPAAIKAVEEKAADLVEEIKKLPEEQLEEAKKKVFKDICEEVMGDDENE